MIGPLHIDHEYDVMLTPAAMLWGRGEAALWSPKGQSGLAWTSTGSSRRQFIFLFVFQADAEAAKYLLNKKDS